VTYSSIGSYPARLRVTDDGDPEKSAETIVTVSVTTPPVAPTADADGPYVFCEAWKPWFLDGRNSVNPDEGQHEPGPYPGDTIQSYAWDLNGDGQFDDAFGPTPHVTAFFSGLGPGSYLVYLKVTDTTAASYPSSGFGNLSDTATAQVFVLASADAQCACVTLTAAPLLKQVQLAWTDYPGAASYNVYRGTISGGPYLKVANVATTSFTDSPGGLDQVYYYVVRPAALNGDEYCQSNEASAEPLHPPPTTSVTLTNMSNLNRYYYYLAATSESFGSMQLQLWVRDTGSSMVVGPIPNKSIVYIRENMTSASSRDGNATVKKLILCKGQAEVWATDPIGQSSPVVQVP
jgi:hypothetical protein